MIQTAQRQAAQMFDDLEREAMICRRYAYEYEDDGPTYDRYNEAADELFRIAELAGQLADELDKFCV